MGGWVKEKALRRRWRRRTDGLRFWLLRGAAGAVGGGREFAGERAVAWLVGWVALAVAAAALGKLTLTFPEG